MNDNSQDTEIRDIIPISNKAISLRGSHLLSRGLRELRGSPQEAFFTYCLKKNVEIWTINFSPDNSKIAVVDDHGNLILVCLKTGRRMESLLHSLGPEIEIWDAKFTGTGEILVARHAGLPLVTIINCNSGATRRIEGCSSYSIWGFGNYVADISEEAVVTIWSTSELDLAHQLRCESPSTFSNPSCAKLLALSPDGKWVAILHTDYLSEYRVSIWDVKSGEMLFEFQHPQTFLPGKGGFDAPDGEFSTDSRYYVSIGLQFYMAWDLSSCTEIGQPIKRWDYRNRDYDRRLADDEVWGVEFFPNGLPLIISWRMGTLKVLNTDTQKVVEISSLNKDEPLMGYRDISPCGSRLIGESIKGTAKLYDIESCEEICSWPESNDTSHFSSTGAYIVIGSLDGSVALLDSFTGAEIASFSPPNMPESDTQAIDGAQNPRAVSKVAMSPDESTIAAGYFDGTVRVWRANLFRDFTRTAAP